MRSAASKLGSRVPRLQPAAFVAIVLTSVVASGALGSPDRPNAPFKLEVRATTPASVTLAWKAVHDRSTREYGLYVSRELVGTAPLPPDGEPPSGTIGGLECATTYSVGVDVVDLSGQRSEIAAVNASTAACTGSGTPSTPDGLSQTAATETSISLSWTAVSGATAYGIYVNGGFVRSGESPSETIGGLACDSTYVLGVDAVDAAGNRSGLATLASRTTPCSPAARPGDTTPPGAPTQLTAADVTATDALLSWSPPLDKDVAGYGVYLGAALAGTVATPSYRLSGLSCGQGYEASVDAYDTAGNRSARASLALRTSSCPVITRTYAAESDSRVEEASPDRGFGGSYLRVDGGGDPDVATYVRFTVTQLAGPVQRATLRLRASSNTSDGPAVYATGTGWTEPGLTWANRPAPSSSAVADAGSVAAGSWLELDVTRLVSGSGVHAFVLVSSTTDGLNMDSRETSSPPQLVVTSGGAGVGGSTADSEPPTAPTGLARTMATETSVSLAWSPATDNVGVEGYDVSINGTKIGSTATSSYSASGLVCGASYSFGVTARDAAGNVSPKATLTSSTSACSASPPSSVRCDKVASPAGSDGNAGTLSSPYRTPDRLVETLAAGQTGCLRAGTYGSLDVDRSGFTIRSYPGERARLVGRIQVRNGAGGVTLSHVDIVGDGTSNVVKIYAADFTLTDSNVTNNRRNYSCVILGSSSAGTAVRPRILRNVIHDCGDPAADSSKDHGIYAAQVSGGLIEGNLFWGHAYRGIQLYPNAQGMTIRYNIIDAVHSGIVFAGESSTASSNNLVEHNVIAYAETYNAYSNFNGLVGTGNVLRENCLWAGRTGNTGFGDGGVVVQGNLVADPLFANRGARDYRLAAGSQCLLLLGRDPAAGLT